MSLVAFWTAEQLIHLNHPTQSIQGDRRAQPRLLAGYFRAGDRNARSGWPWGQSQISACAQAPVKQRPPDDRQGYQEEIDHRNPKDEIHGYSESQAKPEAVANDPLHLPERVEMTRHGSIEVLGSEPSSGPGVGCDRPEKTSHHRQKVEAAKKKMSNCEEADPRQGMRKRNRRSAQE